MKDFRSLEVWQKAHSLTLDVYRSSAAFPPEERYGLSSQIRRSSVSIASNLAEGCGRRTDPDFARFVQVAIGSASELEYQVLLAHDLGYLPSGAFQQLSTEVVRVRKMLISLQRKLRSRSIK